MGRHDNWVKRIIVVFLKGQEKGIHSNTFLGNLVDHRRSRRAMVGMNAKGVRDNVIGKELI